MAIAAGFMLLFPPFFFTYNGTSIDAGYGFLFIPPKKGTLAASINWSRLLAQWLLIAVVAYVVGIRREGDALRK